MTNPRVLVLGGGDIGSAVAHRLFGEGAFVLICEQPRSGHARRGMAYTDALYDGAATLHGIEARLLENVDGVAACWTSRRFIPIVTVSEDTLLRTLSFDVLVEATLRRNRVPPDIRGWACWTVGLGPGYTPGVNCHIAIETQWGPTMGAVVRDHPTAERAGGPRSLAGVGRERFVPAPVAGFWRTPATIGQCVKAGEVVGAVGETLVRAPIDGQLRGLARDGIDVREGQRLVEVDPREAPQIFGLGERPAAIARGVAQALRERPVGSTGQGASR